MEREREVRGRLAIGAQGAATSAREGLQQACHRPGPHGLVAIQFVAPLRR